MIARWWWWVGEHEQAVPHLEQLVAWVDQESVRRPERPIDFDYFIALVLLGRLDRISEMSRAPQAGGGKLLRALVGLIEADHTGDRGARDSCAKQIVAIGEHQLDQLQWYQALDAQMTATTRFGRPRRLPPHPPSRTAVTDHARYREAFGTDAVATQLRAAQSGEPVALTPVLENHIAELERNAVLPVLPSPTLLLDLAALHRLADNTQASDEVVQQLLEQGNGDANDQAIARMLLGQHEQLVALIDHHEGDGMHDGVTAYAAIARGEAEPALNNLLRWASKQSPAEGGVQVWFHEVIDLARSRLGL